MISKYIHKKDIYFKNVVSRLYTCQNSTQLISYNLQNSTTTILEDESAILFDLMHKNSEQKLLDFLFTYQISAEEFNEFLDELLESGSLNNASSISNKKTISNNTEITNQMKVFHELLLKNSFLYNLHLDITTKCNLHCIHCYHPFQEYEAKRELTLSEIQRIIDDAYDLGVFVVVISGGEPTLRSDFFDIINYISNKGMCIDLYTNALLIDHNFSSKLRGLNIRKISISLYSSQEKTHDKVTQHPGSCKLTKNAIDCLIQHGFNVELKTLLMQFNFDDYEITSSYAQNKECSFVTDISMTPLLNSDKRTLDFSLNKNHYTQLCQKKENPFTPIKNIVQPENAPCNAGRYSLYCDSDGLIYPCVSFRYFLGNLDSGLKKAWHSSTLQKWQSIKNSDFYDYKRYSFCEFCPEICAGIAQLENDDFHFCKKSDCYRAEVHEILLGKEVKK